MMNSHWSMTLRPGGKWSGTIGRGKLLRLTALGGGANMSMLAFNARDLAERYNMPDTLKAQHTSHLTTGNVLMSDNGRAMIGIVQDSLGWHDPLAGYSTRESTDAKYGPTRYQERRNEWLRSGEENFAVELTRHGLGLRDLGPVVNWFSKIVCDAEGGMRCAAGHCPEGASVTLRTEMELLILLSNTPNPLDPGADYPSAPVRLDVLPAAPVDSPDGCVNHCPENRRAYENTASYYALAGTERDAF